VFAETMLSPSFKIRFGNFNMTSGMKTSTSYSLTDTVGQTAAQQFTSTGYMVNAGFQYIYTLFDFTFVLSSTAINLGTLTPGTFATGSHTVKVSAPGQGYSVSAFESSRLKKSGTSDYVPDTTCNSGTCTETAANVWTSTSAPGFGYNVTGNDITTDFVNSTYFRPFPDASLSESPAVLMSTVNAGKDRLATVTYKALISGSQAAGTYQTLITYIATPVY
jgi:hypothetical protein